jgi:hypothetical protein
MAKSGSVLIWRVTPASSRQWSRQDGGATTKLGQHLKFNGLQFADFSNPKPFAI